MSPQRPSSPPPSGGQRPMQDVRAVKQAAQFPAVGMTLRSYKYEPRPGQRGTVVRRGRWQRIRQQLSFKRAAMILGVLILILGGWVGGKFLYNFHKLFGGNIFGLLSSTKLKGEDSGRVTILLAGNSADDPGHGGADLTDSIMLVSIDTKSNKAFLLSIPRDLWVHIPGNGYAKINETYVDGQNENFSQSGYPSGGMGLLEKVVEQDFGVNIDYYALIDYAAVRDAVNAVGGVDFAVKSSDPRGLYDPSIDYATHQPLVKLTNGVHHLNGEQALDLSRARGDAYGSYGFPSADFDRTQHQRELLIDLKSKVVSAGTLANPAKLTSLSDAIGQNVRTDFTVSEVKRLYDLTKNINGNNMQSLSLNGVNGGPNLLTNYTSYSGESALIPAAGVDNFYAIQHFLQQHMSSNPVVQEGANVVVLNGTSVSGLAAKERTRLEQKGLLVSKLGDAAGAEPATMVIDASGGQKPATRNLLVQLYGAGNITTANPYAGVYDADFIIVLGTDRSAAGSSAAATAGSTPAQ